MPISSNSEDPNKLFFWFFPSIDPTAGDDISIWIQGGTGCSSLTGLFQENGPVLWQPGTFKPEPNPYSWHRVTHVVWIDQPKGTGMATGNATLKDVPTGAREFTGFWRNFVNIFGMQHFKVYLHGESFGGKWVPYIADAMLTANETEYFNVRGVQLVNPYISSLTLQGISKS